jgi:hypothetical protein
MPRRGAQQRAQRRLTHLLEGRVIARAAALGLPLLVDAMLRDEAIVPTARHLADALIDAVRGGALDVVRILLADSRVDPSANHNAALYVAVAVPAPRRRLDIIRALLSDPRVRAPTPEVFGGHLVWGMVASSRELRGIVDDAARWRRRSPWLHAAASGGRYVLRAHVHSAGRINAQSGHDGRGEASEICPA